MIDFCDRGGDPDGTFMGGPREIAPLGLSNQEKKDLEAFLETLTGDPVSPARLVDTHAP